MGNYSLVKGVGARSPPGEEHAETDRLEDLGDDADTDRLDGALLNEDLVEEGWGVAGGKDERAEVGRALVAEGAGCVDQGAHAIGLQGRAEERGAPGDGCAGGLLRAEELLLGVGLLGSLVGCAEERGENGELGRLVEAEAEGDGRGLNGGKILGGVSWCDCVIVDGEDLESAGNRVGERNWGRASLTVQRHDVGFGVL
jgi:hypothetical protein